MNIAVKIILSIILSGTLLGCEFNPSESGHNAHTSIEANKAASVSMFYLYPLRQQTHQVALGESAMVVASVYGFSSDCCEPIDIYLVDENGWRTLLKENFHYDVWNHDLASTVIDITPSDYVLSGEYVIEARSSSDEVLASVALSVIEQINNRVPTIQTDGINNHPVIVQSGDLVHLPLQVFDADGDIVDLSVDEQGTLEVNNHVLTGMLPATEYSSNPYMFTIVADDGGEVPSYYGVDIIVLGEGVNQSGLVIETDFQIQLNFSHSSDRYTSYSQGDPIAITVNVSGQSDEAEVKLKLTNPLGSNLSLLKHGQLEYQQDQNAYVLSQVFDIFADYGLQAGQYRIDLEVVTSQYQLQKVLYFEVTE